MASVFIETTIPSYYFETRTDRRSLDWKDQTRRWWTEFRHEYRLVTSEFVLAEFSRAPEFKAAQAAKFFDPIEVLPIPKRFKDVASLYVKERVMPEEAEGDAAHLAIASLHSIDFILTWNCRHLANANKVVHIRTVNKRLGLRTPIIATPFEIIPE